MKQVKLTPDIQEFTLHGQKCELVRRYLPDIGHYYCGYVLLAKPLTQKQHDLVVGGFVGEITYSTREKVGFDTAHPYERQKGKSDNFEYAKSELLDNLALVISKAISSIEEQK